MVRTGNGLATQITGNSAVNRLNGLVDNDIFRFATKVHADTIADYNVPMTMSCIARLQACFGTTWMAMVHAPRCRLPSLTAA